MAAGPCRRAHGGVPIRVFWGGGYGVSWSPSSFRRRYVPGRRVSGRPGRVGRRARQRTGVEVPDLVDPLGELPAVAGALVAVVVDGVVQPLAAIAGAGEFMDVGTAGRGVAVQLDRARMRGLHEELPLGLQPLAPGADLLPADHFGGDV